MVSVYPFYESLKTASLKMSQGNFGLWFNKFVPLSDNFKASNIDGKENEAVEYYFSKSEKVKNRDSLLDKKHKNQLGFVSAMKDLGYTEFVFHSKLISPLITGIGDTHPNEVGMAFDHTMGIPYISASSLKGLVRFTASLNEIFDENGEIKADFEGKEQIDDTELEGITEMFGYSEKTESAKGNVIFLDAYSTKTPQLKVDIMNPHYGDYYKEGNITPPADNILPVPIKFLTVEAGTEFVFRALIDSKVAIYLDKIKKAYEKALTKEGVGAKTAIGYGRFGEIKEGESESIKRILKAEEEKIKEAEEAKKAELIAQLDPIEQDCLKLKDAGTQEIAEIYKKMETYSKEDQLKLAEALKEAWIRIGKWEGKHSLKQQKKIEAIKKILGGI